MNSNGEPLIEYFREKRDALDPDSDGWDVINAAMQQIDELILHISHLASDLEEELKARYKFGDDMHPCTRRNFDNSMEPVISGRKAIERVKGKP